MNMTGEQWLEQYFRPAVSRVDKSESMAVRVDSWQVHGSRLAAQVEALGDTGVLTDVQESAALDALEAAGILPRLESRSVRMSSESIHVGMAVREGSAVAAPAAQPGAPRLLGVLAGPRELGQLDGRPVVLVSAELWSDRFLLDFHTDPGPEFRASRARTTREHLDWMRRVRRGQPADRPANTRVPSPLDVLEWDLRDEHGTAYRRSGGGSEASDFVVRLRAQWSPAPPVGVENLTLIATDGAGSVVFTTEVPRPPG
jgi:hypothetical protein